jgi:hypothetical protein
VQKKPKTKQPKSEPAKSEPAKPLLEPTQPQQRRSLRQIIMNSDQNKKIKRR